METEVGDEAGRTKLGETTVGRQGREGNEAVEDVEGSEMEHGGTRDGDEPSRKGELGKGVVETRRGSRDTHTGFPVKSGVRGGGAYVRTSGESTSSSR